MALLSKLKYSLWTDKPMDDFEDSELDVQLWTAALNELRTKMGGRDMCVYSTVPWLFEECYLYRRVREAMVIPHRATALGVSEPLDPFAQKKHTAWAQSAAPVATATERYRKSRQDERSYDEQLAGLILASLWGNRNDLSLHINTAVDNSAVETDVTEYSSSHVLVDHVSAIVECVKDIGDESARIDIILDNAGFELFNDLLLADHLTRAGKNVKVYLHVKQFPWFVSDATETDVMQTIDEMRRSENEDSQWLGGRLKENLASQKWVITTHTFWTLWNDYHHMESVAPDLFAELSKSQLLIFKGDLNYRKLLGDRPFPAREAFADCAPKFGSAPYCALRTNKSEVICGLSEETLASVSDGPNNDWMVTGDYGVVQFYPAP
ncbi:hypothetical protein SARC_03646 [Sphaeroforma arctica JP610]|uniref:Sugar phosphate phosphatase n=1 Tax=Sphaeroforma arctica JP610 TaxID=667725 RepID=A0A0L0G526_9EUKA|nr:hypothetical protein SARC_03646 [Sphaeroforma arctica JP610]KNC84125.1 hypothetical protein SARC_03646 [Sphaeroforma arctica JP610]|eukprot:XP_014158027.1 hypothetical protein SARC_03646 [Sphaeroforma arctica JP610]